MLHIEVVSELQRRARDISERLRNPSNAVLDDGLDLKRPKKNFREVERATPEPLHAPSEGDRMAIFGEISHLDARIKLLREKLGEHLVSVDLIQTVVAKFYDVCILDMICERRTKEIILPRHVALYLCCHLTSKSLPYIGSKFGGRDHTTVLHARRKIEALRAVDGGLDGAINSLVADLGGP